MARRILVTAALVLFGGFLVEFVAQQPGSGNVVVIDSFETDRIGDFPDRWFNRDGDTKPKDIEPEHRRRYHYKVKQENGNRYLSYEGHYAKHLNFRIGDDKSISLEKTPILSWKWRAHELPRGATEADDSRNDAALSVYVVFGFRKILFQKVPKVIRYTWSSSLPEGTVVNKNFKQQKILVLESGTDKLGQWQTVERNLADDYRRFFGGEPPERPVAILVLSDANNTKSFAKGDYDDFLLKADD